MKHRLATLAACTLIALGAASAQEKMPKAEKPRTAVPVAAEVAAPLSPGAAAVAAAAPGETPPQVVAQFFAALAKGEVDAAYASLTKGSKIAEKPDELRQLKAKTREAIDVFGSVVAYDLVESKNVGSRLLRSTYVSLGKVFPLRWRFYFYKPDDVWRLIDLRVDDKLPGIFDEPEDAKAVDPKP